MIKPNALEYSNEKLKKRAIKYSRKKLHFIAYILKSMKDPAFIGDVLNVRHNPLNITIESYGQKNEDKIIYFCDISNKGNGFFADYRVLLDVLVWAERFQFLPVVRYGKEFTYAENHKVNNANNPFEYYFEQPCEISVEEALDSYNVVSYLKKHRDYTLKLFPSDNAYKTTEKYINYLGFIAKKYIRLNQYVKPFIENNINQIISNKKTLGIHVRGTDFKLGVKDHPVWVKPDEYFKCIYGAIDKFQFEQVFLATDELATVNLFEKELGNKLVYYDDVTRTDCNLSVAFSKSTRENHHYMLGLEVLRDMHTLANCSGLIAGMSQVSICARITKAGMNEKYDFLKILDNGINEKGVNGIDATNVNKR